MNSYFLHFQERIDQHVLLSGKEKKYLSKIETETFRWSKQKKFCAWSAFLLSRHENVPENDYGSIVPWLLRECCWHVIDCSRKTKSPSLIVFRLYTQSDSNK